MTELRHLQKVILSIAKDIDQLCQKNGIDYYLIAGSCIGAIRHHGFIPWDDDLDIAMTRKNYNKFLEVAKLQLDKEKYYIQEGRKDWPLDFSKIRLKGTSFHEPEDDYASDAMHGIYLDIFPLDNASDNALWAKMQYVLAKYRLCYLLGQRSYKSASFIKKLLIFLASPLKIDMIHNAVIKFIEKYNSTETQWLAFFYSNTRLRNAIAPKSFYGKPKYVKFEDTELPVPENYHEYLTQMFGDYMKLPPENQRIGHHLISADFGKY